MFRCPQRPLVFSRGLCFHGRLGDWGQGEPRASGAGPRRNSVVNPHYERPKRTGPVFELMGGGEVTVTRWNVPGARQSGTLGAARAWLFSSERRWGHYSKIVLLCVVFWYAL